VVLLNVAGAVVLPTHAGATGTPISGIGSSFAAPAIETWITQVEMAPYDLGLSYAAVNSGVGRFEFTNQTTDWAVSDTGYVGDTDTTAPNGDQPLHSLKE
jgi:ABC-type phosphate transport system substrate-binding protein